MPVIRRRIDLRMNAESATPWLRQRLRKRIALLLSIEAARFLLCASAGLRTRALPIFIAFGSESEPKSSTAELRSPLFSKYAMTDNVDASGASSALAASILACDRFILAPFFIHNSNDTVALQRTIVGFVPPPI